MVLPGVCNLAENKNPLRLGNLPIPTPGQKEILIKVSACGVCHTELDEIEGRIRPAKFPIVLGHQVVGIVAKRGRGANKYRTGDRVGVGWIFSACGKCEFCKNNQENLCPDFLASGRDADGGYAEYMKIPARGGQAKRKE